MPWLLDWIPIPSAANCISLRKICYYSISNGTTHVHQLIKTPDKYYPRCIIDLSSTLYINIQCRFVGQYMQLRLTRLYLKLVVLLAKGPGNPPAVRGRTAKMDRFCSEPVHTPGLLHLGGPNPDPYVSTRGFRGVWLDLSVPISGSGIRVYLFMVAFRYPIANRKILTLVYRCRFLMYWPPLSSKTSENCSLPYPENDTQRRVDDFCSCTLGNLSGSWM